MESFAAFITTPANIVAIVIALMAFFSVVTLGSGMVENNELEKRMKSVALRREELRRASRQAMAKDGAGIRQKDEGLYKRIVDKLNLKTLLEDPKVVDKLATAGFRGPKPVSTFYFFRLVMPFVLGIVSALYIYLLNSFGMQPHQKITVVMGLFVAGYYAPNLYISNIAQKRRESIVSAFPDALDLLLICVEAGMSVEAALHQVSSEIGTNSIELAEELSLLVAELSYLPERRLAYEGLSRRTNHPGIKSVCTAMIQAEKYGTPLGTALRVMAKENREMRMSAAEKKASALPAQLTVPMILFFLPVLFVVIMGPIFIKVTDMQKPKPAQAASSAPAN
jgi:tight adherence protein C